jgi:hypothetical protein
MTSAQKNRLESVREIEQFFTRDEQPKIIDREIEPTKIMVNVGLGLAAVGIMRECVGADGKDFIRASASAFAVATAAKFFDHK